MRKVPMGQSIAEVLALEIAVQQGASLADAMRHSVPLPQGLRRSLDQCKSTNK
jgi:hypothetical protein